MRTSGVQLSLQKRVVSPVAIEHEAILLNIEQSLTISLHQKELEILEACGVEILEACGMVLNIELPMDSGRSFGIP
jgi:hypothetical protein